MMPADRIERNIGQLMTQLAEPHLPNYRDDLLDQVAVTKQRRALVPAPARRILDRPGLAAVIAAVLVVAIGGLLLMRLPQQGITPNPSPSTTPSPSPSASSPAASVATGVPIPIELRHSWIGEPRTVPALSMTPGTTRRFDLLDSRLAILGGNRDLTMLSSDATLARAGVIRLSVGADAAGCKAGDVGEYDYDLSVEGSRLSLSTTNDACRSRAADLSGDWLRDTCRRPPPAECLGDLESGTYPSQYFSFSGDGVLEASGWGAMTYTVPAGWANSQDTQSIFRLTSTDDFARENASGASTGQRYELALYSSMAGLARDADCRQVLIDPSVAPPTADGLLEYVRGLPSLRSSGPKTVSVDGHAATWIDVSLVPQEAMTCPDPGDVPAATILGISSVLREEPVYEVRLVGSERMRLVFVQIDSHATATIVIDSSDPSRFDALVARAMPIVQSFSFQPAPPPAPGPSSVPLTP